MIKKQRFLELYSQACLHDRKNAFNIHDGLCFLGRTVKEWYDILSITKEDEFKIATMIDELEVKLLEAPMNMMKKYYKKEK